jgi:hypothetical protein
MSNDSYRSAVISMPSAAQLGGEQPLPFVRFPFFPTSPWYSTNPNVGYQVRFYSTGVSSADSDFQIGSEMIRSVQFDLPVRVIAINGAAIDLSNVSLFTEQNMNLTYLFRVEYTTGDKLHTFPRLASTVVGTQKNPGEIGGHGYNIDQGASLQVGITPLVGPSGASPIRIDITFVCLEMRAPRNFTVR